MMAHFAEINSNNIVIRVAVIDEQFEKNGEEWCKKFFTSNNKWKQTSYNGSIRKNFAGIGYSYDEKRDAFIEPKPYNSWILNEETCIWEAPIEIPKGRDRFDWNENNQNWEILL